MAENNDHLNERVTRIETSLETHCKIVHEKDDRALILAREILDKEVRLAMVNVERRLDILNNHREQVDGILDGTVSKELYDQKHQQLTDAIVDLKTWKDGVQGRASLTIFLSLLAIVVSAIFGLLHFYR